MGVVPLRTVTVNEPTHMRLRQTAEETSMPMKFWADVAIRFFFAHTGSSKLILSARGVTLEEYEARVRAVDKLVTDLIEEGMKPVEQVSPIDEPLDPLFPDPKAGKPPRAKAKAGAQKSGSKAA